MAFRIRLFFLSLLCICMISTTALSKDWRVLKVTKGVERSADGNTWRVVARGTAIRSGEAIRTGKRGRILLSRGGDKITIKPRSYLVLPRATQRSQMATAKQYGGKVDYAIKTGKKPRFTVQTPLLAAVVKGTRFSVGVTRRRTNLSVQEGLVEATDTNTGARVLASRGGVVEAVRGRRNLKTSGRVQRVKEARRARATQKQKKEAANVSRAIQRSVPRQQPTAGFAGIDFTPQRKQASSDRSNNPASKRAKIASINTPELRLETSNRNDAQARRQTRQNERAQNNQARNQNRNENANNNANNNRNNNGVGNQNRNQNAKNNANNNRNNNNGVGNQNRNQNANNNANNNRNNNNGVGNQNRNQNANNNANNNRNNNNGVGNQNRNQNANNNANNNRNNNNGLGNQNRNQNANNNANNNRNANDNRFNFDRDRLREIAGGIINRLRERAREREDD